MNYTDRLIEKILLENAGEENLTEKDRIAEEKAREAASKVDLLDCAPAIGDLFLDIIEYGLKRSEIEQRLEAAEKVLVRELGRKYGIDTDARNFLEILDKCGDIFNKALYEKDYSGRYLADDVKSFLSTLLIPAEKPEQLVMNDKKEILDLLNSDIKKAVADFVYGDALESEYDPEYRERLEQKKDYWTKH